MLIKPIKFDLNKYRLYEKLKAKQGDTESRFLLFQLLDGSLPFNLENRSVRAYMIKPDGKEVFNDLIINDKFKGYCTLELTNQVLAAPGIVKLELMVIEGTKKLTSSVFELEVEKSINSEKSIVSTNEFGALLKGLASLNEYDNYKNEIAEARDGEKNLLTKVKKIDEQLEIIKTKAIMRNNHDKPLLAIIFDDGVRNVFTNGREWFKSNNVNIGLAIHNNTFQQKQLPTQLEVEEISILLNDGHEILSHGYKDEYLNTELPWAEWLIKGSVDMYRDYGINCRGYVPAGGIILDKYVPLVRENFDYAFCNYSNGEVDYEKDKYHINRVQIDTISYSTLEPILIKVASEKGILFLFSHDLKLNSNECDNINSISAIIKKALELGYDIGTPNNCLIKAGIIDNYDRKNKNYRYNLLSDKTFDLWNFSNHTDVSPSNIIKDYKMSPLKNIRCGINNSKVGEYLTLLGELDIELSDVNMFGEFSFKSRNELGKRGNKASVSLMGYNGDSFVKYLTYHDFVIGTDGEEYDNSVKFGIDKDSLINKIKINITLISEYEGSFICRLSEPYLSLYQY